MTEMQDVKVTRWISYEEADDLEMSIGGLGGWFGFHGENTWDDYFESCSEEVRPYAIALRDDIIARGIKGGGDWHQGDDEGVPLFNDRTVGSFSYRAWGDLLAATWTFAEDRQYNYMDFYMTEFP
jgi:hypothetical protein